MSAPPSPFTALAEALAAAARGWPVFPCHGIRPDGCCTCGGAACSHPGKHPRSAHGHQDATTDPVQIHAWAEREPDGNFGLACAPAGLAVVDIDPRAGGDRTWDDLVAFLGAAPPATVTVATGGGGRHLYYRAAGSATPRDGAGRLGPGIDLKHKGYVILPGGRHASGECYRWEPDAGHDDLPPSPFPARLSEYVRVRTHAGSLFEPAAEGSRNTAIFRFASRLRGMNTPAPLGRILIREAAARCTPPLPEAEALAALRSAYDRYAPNPANPLAPVQREDAPPSWFIPKPAVPALPVPPFPVEALPPVARALVEDAAAALGCPPEFVATPLLAIVGAAAGRGHVIEPSTGWQEYPILFTVVVGPPGAAKSPAIQAALEPLLSVQRELFEVYRRAREQAGSDAQGKKGAAEEIHAEHVYTTDATTEAICAMLPHSSGMVIVSDELLATLNGFNAYRDGNGSDRQFLLSRWSALPFKTDRKTAGSVHVEHPVVTLTGGIQPDRLPALARIAAGGDGLIERFLFAWPETRMRRFTGIPRTLSHTQAMGRCLHELRGRDPNRLPRVVTLAPAALSRFSRWVDQMADQGDRLTGLEQGFVAKSSAHLLRIALICHLLRFPAGGPPLTVEELEGAIAIFAYFHAHSRRVYARLEPHLPLPGAAGSAMGRVAQRVLRVLTAETRWVGRRELLARLNISAAQLTEAVEELTLLGLVEATVTTPGPQGGQPAQQWRLRRDGGLLHE